MFYNGKKSSKITVILLLILVFLIVMLGFNTKKPDPTLPKADSILVEKQERLLSLYKDRKLVKQYQIALGFSPVGAKEKEGDGKTPEGIYFISSKNPKSSYHLSLKISYPLASDVYKAKLEQKDLGGDIMIHGIKKGLGWIGSCHRLADWTRGCIAVTNDEMEEIYAMTDLGTIVEIKP